MHLQTFDHFRITRGWIGQSYHFHFHSKSRGAAILINKNIPFVISSVRYIIVVGRLYNTPVILANVHVPHWNNNSFFHFFYAAPILFLFSERIWIVYYHLPPTIAHPKLWPHPKQLLQSSYFSIQMGSLMRGAFRILHLKAIPSFHLFMEQDKKLFLLMSKCEYIYIYNQTTSLYWWPYIY